MSNNGNLVSSRKNSQDSDFEGIEGLLYLVPVIGVILIILWLCSHSPVAMSWLTQCVHESVSLLVAVGFMGWFFWTLIRDKLAVQQIRQRSQRQLKCSNFSRCRTNVKLHQSLSNS